MLPTRLRQVHLKHRELSRHVVNASRDREVADEVMAYWKRAAITMEGELGALRSADLVKHAYTSKSLSETSLKVMA